MYFKRLEIFGFKSFAEKTVLNFEPGVTAVVGPNGCGKSNVFDAIRWVLGEQSAKSMRGSSMEDVIFNGTAAKAALGFAEVSVTFDNSDKSLPIEFEEVTVTRRLFRSGKSEYLINKSQVRLKDVQQMFMGTGVGAEAYSLVAQGRVDQVVSAKPEDRRQIFDEASGITKYKAKKREALNKLKDTDANLLRINDIVTEVKRQIASLERQAKKAQRYKENFEKLKQYETIFAAHQMSEFDKARQEVKHLLDNIDVKETELAEELEELRVMVSRETMTLEELEESMADTRARDIKLENEIEINQRQIGFNQERIESLTTNESRLSQQKEQLTSKVQMQRQKIEEFNTLLQSLSDTARDTFVRLDQQKKILGEIVVSIGSAQSSIQEDEQRIMQLTGKAKHLRSGLTEILKETQSYLAKKRRLGEENIKVTEEKKIAFSKMELIEQQLAQLNVDRVNACVKLSHEQHKLESFNQQLSQLDDQVDELEGNKRFLITQMEFVEKLEVQYNENPERSRQGRFYTVDGSPLENQGGFVGKIQQVNSLEDGQTEVYCEMKFLELNPQDVETKVSGVDQEILRVRSLREQKQFEIHEHTSVVEDCVRLVHDKEKAMSVCRAQREDLTEEALKLDRELEAIDIELNDADDQLASLKNRDQELNDELRGVDHQLQTLQDNIQETQTMIVHKTSQREEVSVLIAQLETEANAFKDKEQSLKENLTLFTDTLDEDLKAIERLDNENVEQVDKKETIRQEIADLHVKIEEVKAQKDELVGVLSEADQQKVDLSQRISSMRASIEAIEKELQSNKDLVHNQAFKNQELDYKVQSLRERLMQAYQLDLDEIIKPAEPVQEPVAEETVVERESDVSFQDGQKEGFEPQGAVQEASEGVLEEASEPQAVEEVPQPELNIDDLVAEIDLLKKRCQSFGSVNLDAMQEFEDLKDRFAFLTKQQSDLLESKDSLMKTIQKINRTTKQLFIETFTKVNEEFRVYYRMLFGGGEAELILNDPDNALESGIDIVARPPGKKLQNINLLSGGEKTMTAIALIFAVFKVNPSPFCVLDEIDAALDEANVERFATVLEEFAKIAQFIIITHNKKTIDHANVMYGVTMQETGVSRLVSVKLSESQQKQTAEAEQSELAAV